MLNDVWMRIAQFLGTLNGENVKRESYVRTPEYEAALEAWKETEQEWEVFLETLPAGEQEKAEEMKELLEDLRLPRRNGLTFRGMQTACRHCTTWGF